MIDRAREHAPCVGCPYLYLRWAEGSPGRPECARGVEYGQPGCRQWRAERRLEEPPIRPDPWQRKGEAKNQKWEAGGA